MASINNIYNSDEKTYINASHLKRAGSENGSGNILWSRDIDWEDISISSNLWRDAEDNELTKLTSLLIIQKLEDLFSSLSDLSDGVAALNSRVTALENPTPTPTKVTISNILMGATSIADGSSMNITFKTNTAASINISSGANGTGWQASVTSSTGTSHTIKVENLNSVSTVGSIAANTIKITAVPSDTINYLTSDSTSVQTSAITLAAKPVEPTKVTISNISMGATSIADGSSMNITFKTNTAASITISSGASGTGWKATVTSSTGTSHTIKVENLTSTTVSGSITANTIKVTAAPSDTTNYLTSDSTSVQTSTITLSAAAPQTVYYSYVGTDLNELLVEEATGDLKSDIAEQIKSIAGVKTYTSVPSSLEEGVTIDAGGNYVYVIAPTETLNNATTYLVNAANMTIVTEVLGTFTIGTTEYTVRCTPSEVSTVITAWKN